MTHLQAIRWFASYVANTHVVLVKDNEWCMDVWSAKPRLHLPQDLFEHDDYDDIFRSDFVRRCPVAINFSDITLTILHEIGHYFTREVFFSCYTEYENVTGFEYFSIPYEVAATDWAIAWLQDAENREIAKRFEEDFDA